MNDYKTCGKGSLGTSSAAAESGDWVQKNVTLILSSRCCLTELRGTSLRLTGFYCIKLKSDPAWSTTSPDYRRSQSHRRNDLETLSLRRDVGALSFFTVYTTGSAQRNYSTWCLRHVFTTASFAVGWGFHPHFLDIWQSRTVRGARSFMLHMYKLWNEPVVLSASTWILTCLDPVSNVSTTLVLQIPIGYGSLLSRIHRLPVYHLVL